MAWIDPMGKGIISVNYCGFIAERVRKIMVHKQVKRTSKTSDQKPVIYNIFIRLFTAFDHDQDGKLGCMSEDHTIGEHGIRETGTFLKTIALLPYLKKLGINTIHLLPITTIGVAGRKGDLGSPYAIKNPYMLDPLLADPMVDLSVEEQFAALVEAAHLMGMRVVQEFIFRTASIDSDWTISNPEWFYWIMDKNGYRPPVFNQSDLEKIKLIPKGRGEYIPPPKSYRKLFDIPPAHRNPKVFVASAFADWPPDDLQPPWTDVTYLRLYHYDYNAKNNFNYIAYNTIRFYDPELARNVNINQAVWDNISEIIPHFQTKFGIDGAMIDMGHALPAELKMSIISKARKINKHFTFWDENFENTIKTKEEGYDAVIGGSWHGVTKRKGFRKEILKSEKNHPLPYFGTAETHNTPRFGFKKKHKKIAVWLLFNILPQSMPFLHNGFELNESLPVNTGLNFSQQELELLKQAPLPLFYKNGFNWTSKINILPDLINLAENRDRYPWIFDRKSIEIIPSNNPRISCLKMKSGKKKAIAIFNTNFSAKEAFDVHDSLRGEWWNLLKNQKFVISKFNSLNRGEVLLLLKD